jgi:quinol monooxygenase YgiN
LTVKAQLHRIIGFSLGVALLAGAASAAEVSAPDAASTLTFVEVRSDAVDHAKQLLREQAKALHRDAPAVHTELLQELARPERLLIVEESIGADAPQAPTLTALESISTAPPNHRTNRAFAGSGAATGADAGALYVMTHVDLIPPNLAKGEALLQELARAGRASAGNVRFEVWRQTDRPNHFNLIAVWRARRDFDAFNASTPAREFRSGVAPSLGALYDERLYRSVAE